MSHNMKKCHSFKPSGLLQKMLIYNLHAYSYTVYTHTHKSQYTNKVVIIRVTPTIKLVVIIY